MFIHRTIACVTVALLGASCASTPPESQPVQALFGPTNMTHVDGGYALTNRRLRLVIDEHTGNASYLGTVDSRTNLLAPPGIVATLARRPVVQPDGYIEARDAQTWQYLGEAADGIGWRKIYCLDGPDVFVTYLIQNRTGKPIDTAIALRGHFAGGPPMIAQPDLYETQAAGAYLRLQAFNEFHDAKPGTDTLIGDSKTLAPNERIGITMVWHVDLPAKSPATQPTSTPAREPQASDHQSITQVP